MKILIDTNILLDVLYNRKEFVNDSLMIFKLCELNEVEGYMSAISIPNIIYIMRKSLTKDQTNDLVNKLLLIFKVVDLKSEDLLNALTLDFNDYEDAIQCASAKRIKAQYILTRNLRDFKSSPIKAIEPFSFLSNHTYSK